MTRSEEPHWQREADLIGLFEKIERADGVDHIEREPKIGPGLRPDFIIRGARTQIVEVKAITPQTSHRLLDAIEQLRRYSAQVGEVGGVPPELILLVPDVLSDRVVHRAREEGVTIYDKAWLLAKSRSLNLLDEALAVLEPDASQHTAIAPSQLAEQLASIAPGKTAWRQYQRLCLDVLNYLFSPPLSDGLWEHENASKVNRRDIIMPNYATTGFWHYLRQMYRADHIVIDAKNYVESISKEEVLQLANYLSYHGTGLFGLIITRTGDDSSAQHVRREQWMMHNKLILVLNDGDLLQMLTNRDARTPPESLIQQKIEDFRLAI